MKNWCPGVGVLVVGVLWGINHFIKLPDFIFGLGLGLGIALELLGVFAIRHDMTKVRRCKKRALHLLAK